MYQNFGIALHSLVKFLVRDFGVIEANLVADHETGLRFA